MEIFYLFIVIVLVVLALSDLVVGVSNDAVNFVNSAIGSKAATFRTVMIIAALGVLVGATFSSGMMEVARKGIFNPEHFAFKEIMIIFLAVMITDVLLLDMFNTAGLPTSTTVSLVFELLGAAFAVSTIKIIQAGATIATYAEYINTGKVFAIISGILLSIAIGFTIAALIQYFVRMVFTFKYEEKIKYFGALWGGIAFSAMVYFLFVKGAKGSSFLTPEVITWFNTNTWLILLASLIGSAVIFQVLFWLFKINILKIIVMAGTFALAMAFAGNDLVNFIGVPLAGLESFQIFQASGSSDPGGFMMEMLRNPVKTPTFFLLIAGTIMVITLFVNKKARSVTSTTINLGRQDEGDESFQSSLLARGMVSMALQMNKAYTFVMPKPVLRAIDTRFQQVHKSKRSKDGPAFDLVRASVILMVSSILITIGTNLKLPLSTTYITFMVAMGASLADRAWGRESAVYRVSGVVTVIGGWFFTALIAFTIAGIMATLIYYGGLVAIIALIGLALFFVYRTHIFHQKKEKEKKEITAIEEQEEMIDTKSIYDNCELRMNTFAMQMADLYQRAISGLVNEKRKQLNKLSKELKEFQKENKAQRKRFDKAVKKLDDSAVEAGVFMIQVLGQMKETHGYMKQLQQLSFDYVENHHPPFLKDEKQDLIRLSEAFKSFLDQAQVMIRGRSLTDLVELDQQKTVVSDLIDKLKIDLIHKLKKAEISTRKSMAVMDLLTLTSNLLDHSYSIVLMQRRFLKKIQSKI
ncbi:MAG: inorganic phosphate transporter [Bacteroidales bacterium]|nr:inorganic phosphate transporter [Bacteroidales bacterium]